MNNRNYGIDLLRMVSMLMVVMIHVLEGGGVLAASVGNASYGAYGAAWFLKCLANCAVDCFALISGYVGFNCKFRYRKIALMWLQAFLYCFGITLIFFLVVPGSASSVQVLGSMTPVLTDEYWYFTQYFCMFFFIPFMNILLKSLDEKKARILGVTIIALLSLAPFFFAGDLYSTSDGHSVLWLSSLYLLGGILNICNIPERVKTSKAFVIFVISVLITWAGVMLFGNGDKDPGHLILNYTSLTMIVNGACAIIIFSKIKFGSGKWKKLISFFAPAAFGVYLIHTQDYIWWYLIMDKFSFIGEKNALMLVLLTIVVSICIYLVCSLIDICRIKFFKIIGINKFVDKIADYVVENYSGRFLN